ncbi:MAG TPA: cupin domain-containing protein [Geobacteraceae bacterium]|nr:cupin domain-containing protein [Geobacteraceae bacterium]
MSTQKTDVKELNLGQKIRRLRQEERLTLQDLSDLSGLSKPLLSQIENDQVIPPIATLLKIAKGLKVGIHYFFEEEEDRRKVVLMRNDELKFSRRRSGNDSPQSYLYHSLAPGMRHKSMEPFLVAFETGEWDDSQLYSHEGEEFIYLLEGELEFHFGTEVMVLQPGDSIYYNSSEPHGYISIGEKSAKAVAVLFSK